MKKYVFISTILIMVALLIPFIAHAATFISSKKSFGGRVLMTEIPDVTCTGTGTGPVVVTGSSADGSPYYADMFGRTPKAGDWILGLADYNQDYSTCYINVGQYRIEFPVTKTNYYGVSGSSFF
jgi:hypothetical protein